MFKLIRLPILMGLAFLAGFLWNEINLKERCEAKGGEAQGGVCYGAKR